MQAYSVACIKSSKSIQHSVSNKLLTSQDISYAEIHCLSIHNLNSVAELYNRFIRDAIFDSFYELVLCKFHDQLAVYCLKQFYPMTDR